MKDNVTNTLYRNLLRIAKQFESPTKKGPLLTSLLYRHGRDDFIDYESLRPSNTTSTNPNPNPNPMKPLKEMKSSEEARDLSKSYHESRSSLWTTSSEDNHESHPYYFNHDSAAKPQHVILYKNLLREVIGGPNVHMMFAIQAKERRKGSFLTKIIQREFRNDIQSKSYNGGYSESSRRNVAFLAFKELNKKLKWFETIGRIKLSPELLDDTWMESYHVAQEDDDSMVLSDVSVLPTTPASSYLRPGCFLVAHPLLTGIFNQSVICILDHTEADNTNNNDDSRDGGTYGLIVNQPLMIEESNNVHTHHRRRRKLNEIIRNDCLPEGVKLAFGDCPVRSGGPVNMSVQMIRIAEPIQESKLQIGGNVLPMIQDEYNNNNDDDKECSSSTALNGDSAIYFGGDIIKGEYIWIV